MASLVKELQALHRHREDLSFTPAVFLSSAQAAHPLSSSSSGKAAEQMELPDDLWGGLGWLKAKEESISLRDMGVSGRQRRISHTGMTILTEHF